MAKKGNNEGSIYKDKQGRWRGQVTLPSADGKIKKKYFYGKTKKEVTEKVNELLNQIRTNTYIEPCKMTLYEWLCTWLETYNRDIQMTTKINYDTYIHANFHALRHTFATRAIENGVNVKALSDILGHATVQITMDLYCHSSLDLMRGSMNKIAGLF